MSSPIITPQLWAQVAQAQKNTANLPVPSLLPNNSGMAGMAAVPDLGAPAAPTAVHSQAIDNVNARNNLLAHGDGISQISNPWLRGFARVADVAGQIVAPGIERLIPGTVGNHNMEMARANARVTADQAQALQQAQTEQEQAKATQEEARAAAYANPQKAVDASKTVQTDDGVYQLNPDTGKYDIRVGDRVEKAKPIEEQAYEAAIGKGMDPLSAYGAVYGAKNQKADSLPQQYLDAVSRGDTQQASLIKRTINDTQTMPKITVLNAEAADKQGSAGTWTLGSQPDGNGGTKSVMFNSKTGEVKDAPGGLTKQSAGVNAKIGNDEQKRADLAQNMNENINSLEEIAARRPELFGPIAGRLTDMKVAAGTSDPDIAKLEVIKHQLGMVSQGVHGMRSSQGLEASANALVNGYHNSPEALKAALESARGSAHTFMADAENPGKARSGAEATVGAPSGKADYVYVPGKGLVKQ